MRSIETHFLSYKPEAAARQNRSPKYPTKAHMKKGRLRVLFFYSNLKFLSAAN